MTTSTERGRRRRERQRDGRLVVMIEFLREDVEGLVRSGLLHADQAGDRHAAEAALVGLLSGIACDEIEVPAGFVERWRQVLAEEGGISVS